MPSPMVQNPSSPSTILSRNLHLDTGQSSIAPRKFTTLMNKVNIINDVLQSLLTISTQVHLSQIKPLHSYHFILKVELYPKINLEKPDIYHGASDKDALIKPPVGNDYKFDQNNSGSQRKQKSSGRVCSYSLNKSIRGNLNLNSAC